MTHKIYISGKITGVPDLNRPKFSAAKVMLKDFHRSANVEIINPHELCADITDTRWEVYMKKCLSALVNSQEVIVLDDWKKSRGAIIEVLIANWLNIPVCHIETPQTRFELKDNSILGLFIKLIVNKF